MGVIEFVPLRPEHVDQFEPDGPDAMCWSGYNIDSLKGPWAGKAGVALHEGRPVAIFGVAVYPDNALVWLLVSSEGRRFPLSMHKAARAFLPKLMADLGVPRLRAEVLVEHDAGQRWAKRLGFVYEGDVRDGVGGWSLWR